MVMTGHCLCGQVRLAVEAEPIGSRACWCRLCQYLAAGNATVNVLFPTEAVHTQGTVKWYESTADSGNLMKRGFCPECGTQIFSYTDSRPHITVIRSGVLDEPDRGAPAGYIWTDEAPAWAHLDPELPAIEGQPPAPSLPGKG